MHRLNLRVVGLGAGAIAAIAVAITMVLGSFGSVNAAGGPATPTNTPGPAPTAKPADSSGTLTGVYDIVVDNAVGVPNPLVDLYHCIGYTQHRADDTVKSAAVCFDNQGLLANTDSEPLDDPVGEGPDGMVGPPPPPPYGLDAPSKGGGSVDGSGNLEVQNCFDELGPPSGPNIVAILNIPTAATQLSTTGVQVGTVEIYTAQPDSECTAAQQGTSTLSGGPALGVSVYPAFDDSRCLGSDCDQSPYRVTADADFDDDGCSDEAELNKLLTNECGDDPWNPNDVNNADTDIAGDYSLLATVLDSDCTPAGGSDPLVCEYPDPPTETDNDYVAGFYYSCLAHIEQSGKNIAAWASCYIDSPGLSVNPQRSPTCPAGCGDGHPGSPPPGVTVPTASFPTVAQRLFSDPATAANKQTKLTGTIDNTKNLILLSGCFEDDDMTSPLMSVYVQAALDLHTMHGFVQIYSGQTAANCQAGTPTGSGGAAQLDAVRQAPRNPTGPHPGAPTMRDADSDGCGDAREMGSPGDTTSANLANTKGGVRDPSNHYDYMEPTGNGLNRVDDIVATVNQYFDDDDIAPGGPATDDTPGYPPFQPGYDQDTDRSVLAGANDWNLGPPNGLQRVDDIVASVKSYFNDCNDSNFS
jgi:hypothetical protein